MQEFIVWLNTESEEFQFVLYGFLLFVLVMLEFSLPLRKYQGRKKRWVTNFLMTFLNIIIMGALPVSFLTASIYAEQQKWGLLNFGQISAWLALIGTLLLRGFISFFTHFCFHKIPFLWRIHRVHHFDTEMDVSTTVRFHPFEFIINLIIGVPLIIVFGLTPWALLFYDLLDLVITMISHANITLPARFEQFLRYFIVTPDLHRIHHSSYQPETDSNFSAVFPVWDIVFKSFKTHTHAQQTIMEIGLNEVRDQRTNNLLWLLLSPFVLKKEVD